MTTTSPPRSAATADLVAGALLSVASTVVVIGVLSRFDVLESACAGLGTGRTCDPAGAEGVLLAGRLAAVGVWTLGIAALVASAVQRRAAWPWPLLAIALMLAALWIAAEALGIGLLP